MSFSLTLSCHRAIRAIFLLTFSHHSFKRVNSVDDDDDDLGPEGLFIERRLIGEF